MLFRFCAIVCTVVAYCTADAIGVASEWILGSLRECAPIRDKRMSNRSRVTIREVAERVGVHPSTVSRVLNPATRGRITPEIVEKAVSYTHLTLPTIYSV